MEHNENLIMFFTAVGHFFTHFTMLVFPALVTTISRDLGVELHLVFELSFLMYLLYGLGAVPWGFIADKWDCRWVLALGTLLASIGLILASMAASLPLLALALGATGLGNAAYHPAGLALISRGMRVRGRAMGFNGVFGNIGIAMGPLMAGLFAWIRGWRSGFLYIGLAGLLYTVAMACIPFGSPSDADNQKGESVSGAHALRLFIILGITVVFSGLAYRSFTLILPAWLESRLPEKISALFSTLVPPAQMTTDAFIAALISGSMMIFGMFGQLVGGLVSDRWNLPKSYILFFGLALTVLACIWFFNASIVLLALFSFFLLGVQPIENSLYSMLIPARWRSSGYGIKFALSFGVGSLAVAMVSRYQQYWGVDGLITLVIFFLLLTVVCCAVFILMTSGKSIRHLQNS